jgi:predicted RNA-binding Zn-ribbon protein involved in translation (DUF1610 family)
MKGICPNCGNTELVHRTSWMRPSMVPKCSKCGTKLKPDESAKRTLASRKSESRREIVRAVQDAMDEGNE